MDPVLLSEADRFAGSQVVPWGLFSGKTVAVTGATGLIGHSLCATLSMHNVHSDSDPVHIVALVRDTEKASTLFRDCMSSSFDIVYWDANKTQATDISGFKADYVIHTACATDSRDFLIHPVETINTVLNGTANSLAIAARDNAAYCLLSTMEIYGQCRNAAPIRETDYGLLDPVAVRNSYPESKRLAEALTAAYSAEYGIRASIVRLAQSFGPGVRTDDRRVFAEFARKVCAGEDIVLLTDGKKRNAYIYTFDAVTAILSTIARAEGCSVFNVANEHTECSILEMATMVADRFGNGHSNVTISLDENAASQFRKGDYLVLDTSRIRNMGWSPCVGLEEMYEKMIAGWDRNKSRFV